MGVDRRVPADGVSRRSALSTALGSAVVGMALAVQPKAARAQSLSDIDALNLMLNLEYLQAQFGSAVMGVTVDPSRLTGNGVPGVAVVGGRTVKFSDTMLQTIIAEMAGDNRNHLTPIRVVIGALAVRQPLIDISAGASAPFTIAMRGAGVIASGDVFDPYASEESLLYALFLLKSISAAAYRGITATISNRVVVQNFTGIGGTEAVHAATIRSYLYTRGATTPRLRENSEKIAAYLRSLSGNQAFQGVSPVTRSYAGGSASLRIANVTPIQTTGDVTGLSARQLLNQLYLNPAAVTSGGFFPEGVNGTIRTSAAR